MCAAWLLNFYVFLVSTWLSVQPGRAVILHTAGRGHGIHDVRMLLKQPLPVFWHATCHLSVGFGGCCEMVVLLCLYGWLIHRIWRDLGQVISYVMRLDTQQTKHYSFNFQRTCRMWGMGQQLDAGSNKLAHVHMAYTSFWCVVAWLSILVDWCPSAGWVGGASHAIYVALHHGGSAMLLDWLITCHQTMVCRNGPAMAFEYLPMTFHCNENYCHWVGGLPLSHWLVPLLQSLPWPVAAFFFRAGSSPNVQSMQRTANPYAAERPGSVDRTLSGLLGTASCLARSTSHWSD